MRYYQIFKAFFLIGIGAFISCSEDEFGSHPAYHGSQMTTTVNVQEMEQINVGSRAGENAPLFENIPLEGLDAPAFVRSVTTPGIDHFRGEMDVRATSMSTANFYNSYGLLMYQYDNTDTWASVGSTTTPKIYNEEVLRSRGWMTNEFWPGVDYKVSFYGYAPYNDPNITNMSSATDAGVPWLSYEVPDDANDQNDLLISWGANDVAGSYDELVSNVYGLHFRHVCTAIRFAVGDQMAPCTIKRIELQNIYGAGDYTFGDASWTLTGNPDRTFYLEQDLVIKKNDQNKILTTGNNLFMMLPQTTPSDAMLVITVDDGEEHEMAAKLDNKVWRMGTTVTYYLSTAEVDGRYILTITQPADVLAEGGDVTYDVASYYMSYYGSLINVPWKAKCYVDGVERNIGDVFSNIKTQDVGNTTPATYTATVKQQEPKSTTANVHTAALRSQTMQGTADNPIDLSGGGETANCYVVNKPGYYKIPLVYGNGRDNPDAYGGASSGHPSTSFVDHKGTRITTENIFDRYTPTGAYLIWQDAPQLITPSSVLVSEDKEFLLFTISKENICQGNAVIAVHDEDLEVMWSWHIWVTDEVVAKSNTTKIINYDGDVTSYILNKPLGFCDADYRESPQRDITIEIVQDATDGLNASATFSQDAIAWDMGGNCTYYQWGRKEPFPGLIGTRDGMSPTDYQSGLTKPVYDWSWRWGDNNYNYYKPDFSKSKPSIQTAIKRPNLFYNYDKTDWCTSNARDLWNVGNTKLGINSDEVTKSVYDPCPVGFKMPIASAFTGFSKTGATVTNSSGVNCESFTDMLVNFYTGVSTNTYTIYYLGWFGGDYSGKGMGYGTTWQSWTSGCGSNADRGYGFWYNRNPPADDPVCIYIDSWVRYEGSEVLADCYQ